MAIFYISQTHRYLKQEHFCFVLGGFNLRFRGVGASRDLHILFTASKIKKRCSIFLSTKLHLYM